MITDREIELILGTESWMLQTMVGWREDAWQTVHEDPQVHEDLSTLYALGFELRVRAGRDILDAWGDE